MTLPMGQMAVVIAGPEAFMITPQGEQPMPASMRQQAEEQLAHVPLLLLRQRTQPGFEAVAAGEGKSGRHRDGARSPSPSRAGRARSASTRRAGAC